MNYFRGEKDGYILTVGKTNDETDFSCSKEVYEATLNAIKKKPAPTETTDYRLKDDLTWEPYKVEPDPETAGIPVEEAMSIILGGDGE